ncbi:MAG: transcriptional regulator NrdR [Planctomycetota bacterium]
MRCPYCHTENDKVLDTRTDKSGYTVRRKRFCQSCARRFTTSEQIEQLNIRVVKNDSTRVPLDREKIRRGIERACSKRSIGSDRIERTLQSIEADLYDTGESEIATHVIGDVVLRHLAQLDEVAYIRFASVYLDFDGAEDFLEIVARLKREGD